MYSQTHTDHFNFNCYRSAQIVTGQKDAMDCVVHLMGQGLVTRPMAFLNNHLAGLDAVSTLCKVLYGTAL